MNQSWQSAVIKSPVFLLLICLGIGLQTGNTLLFLLIGALGYLVWTLRHIKLLYQWLNNCSAAGELLDPPNAHGLWGDMFDGMYRLLRKSERSRSRMQAVIDRFQESTSALRDAIVLTNNQGQIEWWNPAAEHILGFRSPDDIGQQITNLIRHPKFASYFESKTYQEPLSLPSPIADERKLLFSITLYGPDNRLLVVRDNTRISQLEQMTKDFVANVSHELRTPLTVISGYLETLQDSPALQSDSSPAVLPKALGQMQSQSRRMGNIIEDLLMLSKLETADSQSDLSPVNMHTLLSAVIHDARLLSGEHNHKIVLKCRSDIQVMGNEKELRSAVSNLVFNAVKYTPDQGRVEIKWSVELNTGYLTVKDNGIGMDSQHIPRLTERFYRIDKSRHAATGGTGLGLAIVKHVLLRHDATLLIKSRAGQGSSFTCQFPHSRLTEPELIEA